MSADGDDNNAASTPPLDPAVAEGLRQAVYAFASFGSTEPRVDLDGKVSWCCQIGGD